MKRFLQAQALVAFGAVALTDQLVRGDGKRDTDSAAKCVNSNGGKTRVAVPSHFYKILVHQCPDGILELRGISLCHSQMSIDGDVAREHRAYQNLVGTPRY